MPLACDTLVRCGLLLTQDDARTVLEDAGLVLNGGRVFACGPYTEMAAAHAPVEALDLSGCLVLPGLVNTHTHAPMTLLRGLADDKPLMEWLEQDIWPIEGQLSPELMELGMALACAEMLRTGTTCFCDMYVCQDRNRRAVERSGMRAVLGEGIFEFPTASYRTVDEAFAKAEDFLASLASQERAHAHIRGCVALHALYTTSRETQARSMDLAERHAAPWTVHLAENTQETAQVLAGCGQRPVPCAASRDLLRPRTLAAHCVDLDPEDIRLLAKSGCGVTHQPSSNFKLASGVAPVPALLQAGVRVSLGTDGAASNNTLNLFAEMRACALAHKAWTLDATALPAQTVLDMATRNGAANLGWPELGRLAPGSAADLIALDLSAPNLQPLFNPVSHVVYAATGHEVRLTMVAGRVVFRDGAFPGFDYPALLAEVSAAARWIRGLARGGKSS
jgi:5-methylthioadenosine/S-adenosylhomocysteine deaminase